MELAVGLVIGFVIGAGVVFVIFDRLITHLIKKLEQIMEEMATMDKKFNS